MAIGRDELLRWFHEWRRVYADNRQLLTELDAAIGDADHGSNLDRGFTAVAAALEPPPADPAGVLKSAATSLIRTVGGASGPLYGTFFLRAAASCGGKSELDAGAVVALFEAGVAGIAERGKAAAGDKTMLDALLPAVAAMRAALEGGADIRGVLGAGAAAARHGMESTIPMQARKGRASYLGERSIGHQDPGATSAWLLLRTAAEHA
jgi:dihydroxyacetone kinase-like protein